MVLSKRNLKKKQQQNHVQVNSHNNTSIFSKRRVSLRSCAFASITITVLGCLAITWKSFLLPQKKKINCASKLIAKDGSYTICISFHNQTRDGAANHGLRVAYDGALVVNSLGPHRVVVESLCDCPPVWMRVVGDGLISIPLIQNKGQQKKEFDHWEGEFTLPMEGRYKIEDRWYGCGNGKGQLTYESTNGLEFKTNRREHGRDVEYLTNANSPLRIFRTGSWIYSKKIFAAIEDDNRKSSMNDYVWVSPQSVIDKKITLIDYQFQPKDDAITSKAVLAKEGTISPMHEFYSFADLGNYELVCWIGSMSAKGIYDAFKAILPLLFPHQRPFKFHYYEATSFKNPDKTWDEQTKMKFRKCKHVLVSFDEVKNPTIVADNEENILQLAHEEYRTQLITFVNHLDSAFDKDFPIWIFTVMEPPMNATNCHSSVSMKISEHPCNVILKDLFSGHKRLSSSSPMFSNRVRLLDNSDLSGNWDKTGYSDILAIVALRIFVLIGHRVKEWRDTGLRGTEHGLMRNGVLEPNVELLPYDWS